MTCGKTLDGAYDIEADTLTVNESSDLRGFTTVDGPSTFTQDMDLQNPTTLNTITLSASSAIQDYTLNLPPQQGTSGQFFTTDGLGNAAWSSVSPTSGGVSYIAISAPENFMTVNGLNSDSTFTNKTFNLELSGTLPTLYGGTGLSTVGTANQILSSTGSILQWKSSSGTGLNILQISPILMTPSITTSLKFDNVFRNKKLSFFQTTDNENQFYGMGVNFSGGQLVLRYHVDSLSSAHVFYAGISSAASQELFKIGGNGDTTTSGLSTINSLTASRLVLTNSSKTLVSLSAGTAGQVLTVVSGTPTWADSFSSVTATSPLSSTGGLNPVLSIPLLTGEGSRVVLDTAPTLINPTSNILTLTNNADSSSSSGALLSSGGLKFSNLFGTGNRVVDAGALTPLQSKIYVNEIQGGVITAPMSYIPLESVTFHINGVPAAGTNVSYLGTQAYALKVTGDSLFTGSVSTSEGVHVAGELQVFGKTTLNGFIALGSSGIIPSAFVTNVIMGPTLPSPSAITPIPTRIFGYSATLPPLEGYSLGWDVLRSRFGLQVNSILLPTQKSYLDSTTLSFSLSGSDKIVIDAGPIANSIKVLTEGGVVAGSFYSNPAIVYSGEFAIYSDNTTQNGAFIDKNNFALWENAVAPSIELDNEGTFTSLNIYSGNLIAGSFYTTSATAYSGEFAIYSDATEQNGAFIDKNDFSLWENATAPSIQLKNEGTFNTLNIFATNLLAGSFYTTASTAYSGELAIYSDATEQNGAFMDKNTLEFWGSFAGVPSRRVVLEAGNIFTGQPELTFYQGALATVTLSPGGLKIQADASPITMFAAGEFSAMVDVLPFVEIEYGSFVFNQASIPVLTMTSTALSTVKDYSMSTAQDFVLQSLGLDGTGSISLTALGAATSSVSIVSASSAKSTITLNAVGATGSIALTAAGASSSISITCAAVAGAITLSCGGILTLSSTTSMFNLGIATINCGVTTITCGVTAITTSATTITCGATAITTGVLNIAAAGALAMTVASGGMAIGVAGGALVMGAAAGAVSINCGAGLLALTTLAGAITIYATGGAIEIVTTVGGVKVSCLTGNSELSSAAGSCYIYAPMGGIEVGRPGNKCGMFQVYTTNGVTGATTGNILFNTHDSGHEGPGSFTVDTTEAKVGDVNYFIKGKILLSSNSIELVTGGGNKVILDTLAATSNYTWKFPSTSGTAGQALLSGGSGAMTWGDIVVAVTSVTASGVLSSTGGTTPDISFTGTLPVLNGGTGLHSYGVEGQLLTSIVRSVNSATSWGSGTITVSGGTTTYPIGSNVLLLGFTPPEINGIRTVTGGTGSSITVMSAIESASVLGTVSIQDTDWVSPATSGILFYNKKELLLQ